ncbi:MAG: ATP-binding protein, partial [Colwellia sp.]|nr:ATP-binding protein [Colwellia sp.]
MLLISLNSVAVQRDLYFNNLSLEQGLNQASVYSLAKDPFGFTWIGTQDGLHRFDGNVIELVPLSASQLPKYRYIRDIKIINKQLYVATTDGLVVINLFTGEKSYPHVKDAVIYSVIEVNQQVWLGSDIGLIILDFDNRLVDYYGKSSTVNSSFCQILSAPKRCSSEIRSLAFDKAKQTVWLGTNTGLFEFNLEGKRSKTSKKLEHYIHYHQVDTKHLAGNAIRKLYIDSYNKLWIASYYGVHYLNLEKTSYQGKIGHIYHDKNIPSTLASNRVLAIAQDENGDIWLGTSNGLSRHRNSKTSVDIDFTKGWENFQAHNASSHSLTDNWIRSLLTDEDGRIWVGTNKGLSVTNIQRDKVAIYRSAKNTAFNNYILSFSEESKHKYWIGTQKGLYIFDNNLAFLLPELQENTVYDTLITPGFVWAATRNGLYQISLSSHKVIQHYHAKNSPVGETFIYKLVQNDNSIWLATTAGLHQLNLDNEQWQSWYKKDGLVDSEIYTLYSHNNKLWIGTAKGLSILDLNNYSFKNYSHKNSSLQSPWIFNIHHLINDRFLIASDGGVYEFNITDENFDFIGITQGNAYSLIQDDESFFWITSNNGLYRYNISSRVANKFVERHGFASNEYNLNASLKNSQGEFLLGTINGFVIFKPESLEQSESLLKDRLVSRLQFEQKSYSLWDTLPLTNNEAVFLAKDFFLGWKGEKIELQLSNPYFALTVPLESIDFNTNINLSNIKSGSYPIPLSSKANNTIQVTKQPHPLLSWWAIVGYLILFSLALTLFIRYRFMRKFNNEILANHKVIATQKDEIEQHLLFKQSLYLQIQHSFKSPVFACRGLSKQMATLLTNNADIDKASLERKNNKLSSALNEISSLIDEFIVLTKQQPIVKISSKQYVLATLMKIDALMTDVAIGKNISLVFTNDASITELDHIFACEKCLYLILENVLSNAIKFSQYNGSVQVKSSKISGSLVVEVSDNGCGFTSKDLTNIFTLYYRGENRH